jgi:hypothetical protein
MIDHTGGAPRGLFRKGDDMNPNQRSETNNQTNNAANEKGTPGAQGKTVAEAPMEHSYPQGAAQQRGQQTGGAAGTGQSGAGPGSAPAGSAARDKRTDLPGGSMQTQQTGGTGAVQGITDSHRRAMEQRSGEYERFEQNASAQARSHGPARAPGEPASHEAASAQRHDTMGAQASTDRAGSQTGSNKQHGTHLSNDAAGALPRSPGNSGPAAGPRDTHLTGAQVHANQQKAEGVHQSNDAAGGYPKSPGGANKLAADQDMDDDTGLSNRG